MASPFIIKFSIYALCSSYCCITPYISVYFERYANATSQHVGETLLVANVVTVISSLLLCFLADQYRIHRIVYAGTLTFQLVSFALFLLPIMDDKENDNLGVITQEALMISEQNNLTHRHHNLNPTGVNPSKETEWFHFIAFCIVVGIASSITSMNLCESFIINLANKNKVESYASIRFWGGIGWLSTSVFIVFLTKLKAPFMMPMVLTFIVISSLNVLAACLWPDHKAFDLSSSEFDASSPMVATSSDLEFTFGNKFLIFKRKTVSNCENELKLNSSDGRKSTSSYKLSKLNMPVATTKLSDMSQFDTKNEEMFRNIRKCSILPISNTLMLEEFELDQQKVKHFKYVTKVNDSQQEQSGRNNSILNCLNLRSLDEEQPKIRFIDVSEFINLSDAGERNYIAVSSDSSGEMDKQQESIDMILYLTIIGLITRGDRMFPRFLILCVIIGFLEALNWIYLLPYIKFLDEVKFPTLSVIVMTFSYLSETCFYYIAPYTSIQSLGCSWSISLIAIIYGIRYMLYLPFVYYKEVVPLELIIAVEMLRSLTLGWFNCVIKEASLKFANESFKFIPQLVESGRIKDGREETTTKIGNSFKSTMIGMSSCFFDGIGDTVGAMVGGWMIDNHGYTNLWILGAYVAFSAGLTNLLIDLYLYYTTPITETTRGNDDIDESNKETEDWK